ncbi:uncharacterized protein MONBRDRAFT_8986 [Monosiga brevicollis MX1]|uniref:ADF-H domain-containing protein n=1 Tax=Monosiga brevicollis TaxID=81824 RepID=A9V1R1_MONBE|nr:uncharacterized protein MONBRDRAFT_8986 [Monosiga brevicollis MX1]EDQ88489.1 predicted protein [Monosiga brevicollis MX1]|eukprot:XP_001746593.1 hypothetical protein [Monosiga brevicollis MX1]
MASGVGINADVIEKFTEMKMGSKHKFVTFCLNDDLTEIVVEKAVQDATYSDFIAALPEQACRYAIYDFDYKLADGGQRNKLLFVVWCPDTARIKDKMLFASSKESLRKKLVGINTEVQATELSEVDYDEILDKVSAGLTK